MQLCAGLLDNSVLVASAVDVKRFPRMFYI